MSTTEQRAKRAEGGSRRKRDIEAYAEVEDLTFEEAVAELTEAKRPPFTIDTTQLPPDDVEPDPNAAAAWSSMLAALRPTLPESGYVYWLAPVVAIGSRGGKICLESPRKLDWYERRYAAALDELAALNGYNGWAIYAGRGGPIA